MALRGGSLRRPGEGGHPKRQVLLDRLWPGRQRVMSSTMIPRRTLGRSGCEVTLFGLGGEGVLRTHGQTADAVRVIRRALDQGVNYCDTAPAYASSMDYYGA